MFSRYNKAIEAGIGSLLTVGVVALGFVQDLPAGIVIGVTVGLGILTTFKVWWVPNDTGRSERRAERRPERRSERRSEAVAPVRDVSDSPDRRDAVVLASASDAWLDEQKGRHQRSARQGGGYRAVKEVASSRTVLEMLSLIHI